MLELPGWYNGPSISRLSSVPVTLARVGVSRIVVCNSASRLSAAVGIAAASPFAPLECGCPAAFTRTAGPQHPSGEADRIGAEIEHRTASLGTGP
jgi:hypothetical protein